MKKAINTLLVSCIMIIKLSHYIPLLPQTGTYVTNYEEQTKWMYAFTEDDKLLEKYNTICDKNSAYVKKEFDSEPVYNK